MKTLFKLGLLCSILVSINLYAEDEVIRCEEARYRRDISVYDDDCEGNMACEGIYEKECKNETTGQTYIYETRRYWGCYYDNNGCVR